MGEWVTLGGASVPLANVAWVAGAAKNPYQQEHVDLLDAINKNEALNEAESAAESALTAIMGRMAAYTGREVLWVDVLNSAESFEPSRYGKDAVPPAVPDKAGKYTVPAKGRTPIYA